MERQYGLESMRRSLAMLPSAPRRPTARKRWGSFRELQDLERQFCPPGGLQRLLAR
ncbi:MAG: hypothetical protein ACLQU9_20455 [Acidimicrobiales bacterium]|jgi:hypothetical protein